MERLSRIPLVLLVAISATVELIINRIGVHLLDREEQTGGALFHIVDVGGLFAFYLTGLLALAAVSWAVFVQIRDQRLLRLADRIALALVMALFLPMAAVGLLFTLPKAVGPHLNTAFGLVVIVLVLGFIRQKATLRAKLGLIYLAAPLVLHCYWLMTQQLPALTPGPDYIEWPSHLLVTAEHLVVVGAYAVFLFFSPYPRFVNLLRPAPVLTAVIFTSAAALFARFWYVEAAQVAYYGLGLNLPPPSVEGLMHVAALFFYTLTLGALTADGGRQREVALGLYLTGVSGFHLQLPYQLLLTTLGMMQLIRGSLHPVAPGAADGAQGTPTFPEHDVWKAYLQRVAQACSAPGDSGEAVILNSDGQQVAHVRGHDDGLPYTMRLVKRDGSLQRLELTVGKHPKDPPAISLVRGAGLRGHPVTLRAAGPKVRLHHMQLDTLFEVRWASELPFERLTTLDDALERRIHGAIGIWPGEGVHYVAQPGSDGWPFPLAAIACSQETAPLDEIQQLVALAKRIAKNAEYHV